MRVQKRKISIKHILKEEFKGFISISKTYCLNMFMWSLVLLIWINNPINIKNSIVSLVLTILVLFILPHNSKLITRYMEEDENKYYFQIIGLISFNVTSYLVVGILFLNFSYTLRHHFLLHQYFLL